MSRARPTRPRPAPTAASPASFVAISASLALLIAAGIGLRDRAVPRSSNGTGTRSVSARRASGGPTRAVGPCVEGCLQLPAAGQRLAAGLSAAQQTAFGHERRHRGLEPRRHDHAGPHRPQAAEGDHPVVPARPVGEHPRPRARARSTRRSQGGVDGDGPQLMAATIHALTGLTINHVLYVDLAGFEGVVRHPRRRRHVHPGREREHAGLTWIGRRHGRPRVYHSEMGHIVDPNTGLDVVPGCQTLDATQALAYVRTRHLRCDGAAPDFYRISAPAAVPARRDQPAPAARRAREAARRRSARSCGNLRGTTSSTSPTSSTWWGSCAGISTGAAEFRSVPRPIHVPDRARRAPHEPVGRPDLQGDPARASRSATSGSPPSYTPPSPANIAAPVVDHASGGKAAERRADPVGQRVRHRRHRGRRGDYGTSVPGNVIAYAPGHVAGGQGRAAVPARASRSRRSRDCPTTWPCSSPPRTSPPRWARATTAARPPSAWARRADARARPVRGRGLPAAAAHPHEREAADPGRRHAHPVPRAGGHRGGGHHRDRHRDRRRRATRCARPSATDPAGACTVTYIPQAEPLGHRARRHDGAPTSCAGEPFLLYLGDNVLLDGRDAVRARSSSATGPTRRSC